jgi:hypothetical protein
MWNRGCQIYFNDTRVCVIALDVAPSGLSFLSDARVEVDDPADPHTLGTAVLEAIERSNTKAKEPDDLKGVGKRLYNAFGVRSWKALVQKCSLIEAVEKGSEITLIPNEKERNYFAPNDQEPRSCSNDARSPGSAVLGLMGESTR